MKWQIAIVAAAICAAQASARQVAYKQKILAMRRQSSKKIHPVSMWMEGMEKPTPPSDSCFNKEAYYYQDESMCWEAWDSYCLPNWNRDEECLAIEMRYQEAKENHSSECEGGPEPPTEECFYLEAYMYTEAGSVCTNTWMAWDNYCSITCSEDPRCPAVNQQYGDHIAKNRPMPDVLPGAECYYEEAYMYSETSDCVDLWREFDNYCVEANLNRDQATCDRIYAEYKAATKEPWVEVEMPSQPGTECYTEIAFNYWDESECTRKWQAWDIWCYSLDSSMDSYTDNQATCDAVNAEYWASSLSLIKRNKGKFMSLAAAKAERESSDNSFERGIASGAAFGVIGAVLSLYAVKRCAAKATHDDFQRA